MLRRDDVVIVQFPFLDGTGGKKRPALVVQSDKKNRRLDHSMVAMITGNITRTESVLTQLLIDPSESEGISSGLSGQSAVKYEHLLTINQRDIHATIGHLPATLLTKIDACLKAAFDLK